MDGTISSKRKEGFSKDKSRIKKSNKSKLKESIPSGSVQSVDETSSVKAPKKRKRESRGEDSGSKRKAKKKAKLDTQSEEIEIDITAPAPPSKKELRHQKKRKPVLPPPTASEAPSDLSTAGTKTDTTHPDRKKLIKEVPRAEFSVWIGNLSYKSDVRALRGWLVRGDKRVTDKEITRMNLPLNADGQSKGFAYVDLLTKEAMEKIISRSEEVFDERHLLIKDGKNFEGRPAERKQRYQVKRTANTSSNVRKDADKPAAPITENNQITDGLARQDAAGTKSKAGRKKMIKN